MAEDPKRKPHPDRKAHRRERRPCRFSQASGKSKIVILKKEFRISLILLTKNSEKTLEPCLASVQDLASEIIVVDDFSTDKSAEIAKSHGAQVFQKKLVSFGDQKQTALNHAREEWVFLIDSDESVPKELAEEIKQAISSGGLNAAYKVPRKNFYFGQWLRYGGKYPDRQVRIFRRDRARFSEDIVHEKVIVDGPIGVLKNPLRHDTYPDIKTWLEKLELFSGFKGEEWFRKGLRPSLFLFIRLCCLRPVWRFDRRYFLKLGLLDGLPGLLACLHDALTEILAYQVLKGKWKKE